MFKIKMLSQANQYVLLMRGIVDVDKLWSYDIDELV